MAELSPLEFYLLVLRPVTVFTGRVNGTPTDPYINISWDGGATGTASSIGTSGAPVIGNTVEFGSTLGGRERGLARLRSWTPDGATGTTGAFVISETDDVGPNIVDDDFIAIKLFWQLWDRVPRQDATDPNNIIFYEDYDIAFNQQTVNWWPMAVAGPPGAAFLEAGQATVNFVGDRSFALAPGATLSTFLWTAHGSNEGTSSSQGTEASPVTFTWTSAGQYLVSLQVTDSNGNTHTNYTWVFIIDPASPTDVAYTKFDAISDSISAFQGGGNCNFTVHGVADTAQFPPESLVLHVARGTITTATGTWPNRSNILYSGYITGDSINQDPRHGTTSFRTVTIDGLMKKLAIYPVRLEDNQNPQNWTQAKDLTVDRVLSYLAHWRSTLSLMTSIRPLNYTAELKSQDFNASNLFGMFKGLMGDAWGFPVADHQSTLYLIRDYNLMTTAERAAITTRKTLHKGLWVAAIDISERQEYEQPTRKIKWNGVYYPGDQATAVPYFSEAPGDVMDSWGNESAKSGFILTTQTDLNDRTGFAYARQNQQYPTVTMRFLNDGSFTVAPQELFPAAIEAGDNNRGLAWTPDLIPRQIRRSYNHQGGYFEVQITFEPSSTGPAGATVTMPSEPPSKTEGGKKPTGDPPEPPPAWPLPTVINVPGAIAAGDGADGFWWSVNSGGTWEQRVNGLGGDQRQILDLIWDPWWFTASRKNTYNPEEAIIWICGYGSATGFIAVTTDAGTNWQILSISDGSLGNEWSDTPAPVVTDLSLIQLRGDIHNLNRFYTAGNWTNGSAERRGWIGKTTDNGSTFAWTAIIETLSIDFSATHESGVLLDYYDSTNTSGAGTVAVNMASALNGTVYGLESSVSGAGDVGQGVKNLTSAPTGTQYTISFYLDINSITIPASATGFTKDVEPCLFQDGSANDLGFLNIGNKTGVGYVIQIFWYDDNRVLFNSDAIEITDAPHLIQIVVNKAAGAGTNDGSIVFKIDGTTEATLADFDLFTDYGILEDLFFGLQGVESGISGSIYIDEIEGQFGGLADSSETHLLSITTDQQNGSKLFTTNWKDGNIYLDRYLTSAMTLTTSLLLGAATINEIGDQTFAAVVVPSAFFDVAGFGDTIWIYGRWTDGTVRHIAKSLDNGVSLSFIGDGSWTTERVSAFLPITNTNLIALLDDQALWETTDGGATWTNIQNLSLVAEFKAISGHASGRLLFGGNTTGAPQAQWLPKPYNSAAITDATGAAAGSRLPGAGDGGSGLSAIVWVG